MVALGHMSPFAVLLSELERGLEEVHEQTRRAVKACNGLRGSNALETTVTQQLAHDSAIFLLDPSLIVLAIRSRASEFDPVAEAIVDQSLVYKFASVIDIQRTKREWQSQTNSFERFNK